MQFFLIILLTMTLVYKVEGENGSVSSSKSISFSQANVDSTKIAGQMIYGNSTNVASFMQNNEDEDVASAFEDQGNKQIASFIYDNIIVKNLGKFINDATVRILEILVEAGQCEKVFSILEEIQELSGGDEQILDKLQEQFSSSEIIFDCVRNITVTQLLQTEDFAAEGRTVAAQDPCREVTNCVFVFQATRFLLDQEQCNPQRVCNFLGFQQRDICERECEN
eukprot:TRINITY_DN1879_c1_g1_i3.p1 TRINITY_DN1879_c1_g1~~TRINITY_DN1879_c1_g1_i3.p1  ORF type:complete len:223 (+),score=26.63 TRINITY_DN1879_c1_g1_i3:1161-1829(+)